MPLAFKQDENDAVFKWNMHAAKDYIDTALGLDKSCRFQRGLTEWPKSEIDIWPS